MLWKVARVAIALESLALSTIAFGIRIPATRRLNSFHIFPRKGNVFTMGNSPSQPNGDNVDSAAAATAAGWSGSEVESADDRSANSSTSMTQSDDNKEEEPDYTKVDLVSKFDSDVVLKQHTSYSPPSSSISPSVHYVFLVHGWLGNNLEMSYLEEAFQKSISGEEEAGDDAEQNGEGNLHATKKVKRSRSRATVELQNKVDEEDTHPDIVIYSVKCNVDKTHDGIRNGGTRLANEIINFIQSDTMKRREGSGDSNNGDFNVTFSLVGNSLGGLYSRFALSKIPYEIPLSNESSSNFKIRLFPNIFCTTATPHLGVSQHTYLPIPRFAETIIGSGMGKTGRDLFRLNSDAMDDGAAAKVNAAAAKTVKRLSSFRIRRDSNQDIEAEAEDDLDCVIRSMCLDDEFLVPLRNFRQRIAYANAYGTDFQVPCQTAAFLNDNSGVGHFLIGARSLNNDVESDETADAAAERKRSSDDQGDAKEGAVPPYVVAILRTDQQSQTQSPPRTSIGQNTASDDLFQMSQSLDALGWTKVFVDMRDSIPVPGLRKPTWMCPNSLDDLIKQRQKVNDESEGEGKDEAKSSHMLTSQDLSRSTAAGDSINVPLGHTVMIANSKSEAYKQINLQGRPVMDKLAHDIVMSL